MSMVGPAGSGRDGSVGNDEVVERGEARTLEATVAVEAHHRESAMDEVVVAVDHVTGDRGEAGGLLGVGIEEHRSFGEFVP